EILRQLDHAAVERCFVTLHVGMGTFKPLTTERLEQHVMHEEAYSIDAQAAECLNRAKRESRRIIAVGTTAARVLESQEREFIARIDRTRICIYPPYEWKHVSSLIINFHFQQTTVVALVDAMT